MTKVTHITRRLKLSLFASAVVHALVVAVLMKGFGARNVTARDEVTLDLMNPPAEAPQAPPTPKRAIKPKADRVAPAADAVTPKAAANAPASAPESTSTQTLSGDSNSNAMSSYVSEIMTVLRKNRTYPRDAIRREEEGVVSLTLKVESDGNVSEIKVKEPSPFASLNLAALQTVERIGQFPKPPIQSGTSIQLTIPMRFKIERL